MSTKLKMLIAGEDEVPRGESVYAIPGTYSWTCPAGVTSVSAVCVGGGSATGNGGGLAYKNNISVNPGSTYSVVVGVGGMGSINLGEGGESFFLSTATVCATGGGGSNSVGGTNTAGDGGGTGGYKQGGSSVAGGGGGAGGYSGTGGLGGYAGPAPAGYSPSAGTGGAGGGGYGSSTGQNGGGGGGVGLHGIGPNGAAGTSSGGLPGGGSGGETGGYCINSASNVASAGGEFGGGSGKAYTGTNQGSRGGNGAVRIVWPGDLRTFPSTDVGTP